MASPDKPTKINLKVRLKNVKITDLMPDDWDKERQPVDRDELISNLQKEIDDAGLVLERVHNAPLLLKKTHGADVYKLAGLLEQEETTTEVTNV